MKVPTIKVTVEVMSRLKEDFGHTDRDTLVIEETVYQGASIMDLLHILAGKYPVFSKKAFAVEQKVTFDYCAVFWNGTLLAELTEMDSELKDGNTVKLVPALYGG